MTFQRASRIRRLAQELPLEAFVLETDSPDIPPAWLQAGQQNTPEQVVGVAHCLAQLRGISEDEVAHATSQAACIALPALEDQLKRLCA
jgi:TatD DNase family protein